MNLAFPALFAFLLVLPGILLRYAYLRGSWGANSPYVVSSITDEVAYGLFLAVGLHLVWASFLSLILWPFGLQIDLDSTLMLLLGVFGKDSAHFEPAVLAATRHPYQITGYFFGLLLFSGALGGAAHRLVRRKKLDLRYPWLRFRNDWHYLISGEILEFDQAQTPRAWHAELIRLLQDARAPAPTGAARPISGVYLSSVVKQGNDSYLYRGIVGAYYFDRAGNLDRVLLNLAHRRRLSEDREAGRPHDVHNATEGERYYDIIGDYFVLRFSEMQTINIEYFSLPSAGSVPAAPPAPVAAAPPPPTQPVAASPPPSSVAQRVKHRRVGGIVVGALLMAAGVIARQAKAGRKK